MALNETISLANGDITDDKVAAVFNPIASGAKVFIINTCHGGGFVNDLGGPNTIIMAGSPENGESSAGFFPGQINEALSTDRNEADADGNGQVSMLEAFNYAGRHPHTGCGAGMDLFQYDDNGDRVSHQHPLPKEGDGAFGANVYLPGGPSLDLDAGNSSSATGSGYAATFTEGDSPVAIVDSDATIFDPGSSTLTRLTVTIANIQDAGHEWLDANVSGTSIAKSYDANTGVLRLTGAETVAVYRQVLRTITYRNTSQIPGSAIRNVTFTAADARQEGSVAVARVTVIAVNVPRSLGPVDFLALGDQRPPAAKSGTAPRVSGPDSLRWKRSSPGPTTPTTSPS